MESINNRLLYLLVFSFIYFKFYGTIDIIIPQIAAYDISSLAVRLDASEIHLEFQEACKQGTTFFLVGSILYKLLNFFI